MLPQKKIIHCSLFFVIGIALLFAIRSVYGYQNTKKLLSAIESNSINDIAGAVNDGDDPNVVRDAKGRSPLVISHNAGSLEVFEYLLKIGEDPNACCELVDKNSILAYLRGPNDLPFLQSFLRFGGNINSSIKDPSGHSATYLIVIARSGRVDLFHEAIRAGIKTDVLDYKGRSPFIVAVDNKNYQLAYDMLLQEIVPSSDVSCDVIEMLNKHLPVDNEKRNRSHYWCKKIIDELMLRVANKTKCNTIGKNNDMPVPPENPVPHENKADGRQ